MFLTRFCRVCVLNGNLVSELVSKLFTGLKSSGGSILMQPNFHAPCLYNFSIYLIGSENSSEVGRNTTISLTLLKSRGLSPPTNFLLLVSLGIGTALLRLLLFQFNSTFAVDLSKLLSSLDFTTTFCWHLVTLFFYIPRYGTFRQNALACLPFQNSSAD